jgi:hypothetical protein
MSEQKKLEDTTIVIQGRVDPECVKHMVHWYRSDIIISTWEDENLSECGDLEDVQIVRSPKPTEHLDPLNAMFQFNSTINGLSKCETKYAIKMRGDEYYSNLEKVVDIIKSDDRIHCLPIFMPEFRVKPFCIGDHFIAGRSDEIYLMFEWAKEWWTTRPDLRIPKLSDDHMHVPECVLGANYVYMRSKILMIPEMMERFFSILPLEMVKDYRITWNNSINHGDGAKRHYYNDFDPAVDGRGSITDINLVNTSNIARNLPKAKMVRIKLNGVKK